VGQTAEMRGYVCAIPRIDILRISAILTDTDSNFVVWTDTDTDTDTLPRILHGYAYIRFSVIFKFISCVLSTSDTGINCKLSTYRHITTHYSVMIMEFWACSSIIYGQSHWNILFFYVISISLVGQSWMTSFPNFVKD